MEIAPRQGLLVFPGDRVKVELFEPKWARFRRHRRPPVSASVVEVVERSGRALLGRYRVSSRRAWVVPRESDVLGPLEVEPRRDVPEGAAVAVDLGTSPGVVSGKVAAFWPDPDAPRAVIEQLIYERGLPREFPRAATAEAEGFPGRVPREETRDRSDLRGLEVVVIDPADAKDHDDGVSWEPARGGGGRLGVHIADVSHYVQPGTALDSEASARGVSCYLPDRVIPMLPEKLSADLCSLKEGEDRLARSVFLDLDRDGRAVRGEMVASVIRPAVVLSYDEVWEVIADAEGGPRRGRAKRFAAALRAMDETAGKMRRNRFEAGSLDFDFPETKVELGPDGEPSAVVRKRGNRAHWLIEEFMIAANRFVGEKLARDGLGVWRIHEPPKMDDVAELEEFLRGLGVRLRRGSRSADLDPRDFQAVLARFKGTPEEYVVSRKVLQSLKLAVYSERNLGHFGLALRDYSHFTSPIRRYADLIVHRLTAPGGGKRYSPRQLGSLAARVSGLERRAQEAEWDCSKKMVLRYLDRRRDGVFDGTVSRAEKFGVFVELDGLGIDGLVRREDLGADRYWLSRDGTSLHGRRSGKAIRVGQRVRVRIAKIDREAGHLDLELCHG